MNYIIFFNQNQHFMYKPEIQTMRVIKIAIIEQIKKTAEYTAVIKIKILIICDVI